MAIETYIKIENSAPHDMELADTQTKYAVAIP